MPEKDQYLYMDDGGPAEIDDLTPDEEAFIEEIDEQVKNKFPDLFFE